MTAPAIASALRLAGAYHIPVFPCNVTKQPLTEHGFKDATTESDQIRSWWTRWPDALIGVPTGKASGLLVIDVDPGGERWLAENLATLQPRRIHRTPRGGCHLLFRYPAGHDIRNSAGQIAPGVDVRGEGGYVIWWPAHGQPIGAYCKLEEISDPNASMLTSMEKPPPPTAVVRLEPSGMVGEGKRNDFLSREAYRLRKTGGTTEQILIVLRAINAARCSPALDESELATIARGKERIAPESDLGLESFQSLADIAGTTYAPKVPIIEALIYPGAWMVVGRPKIGKSWLLLQMLLAVCEGESILGFNCARAAETLAIFSEDDEMRLQGRLQSMGVSRAPANCHIVCRTQFKGLAKRFGEQFTFVEFLDTWLGGHPAVRLVIIDTELNIRQTWRAETPPSVERITETDYKQTEAFDNVALRRGIAIMLVNHARKANGEVIDYHELVNRSNTAFAGCSGSMVMADVPGADAADPSERTRVFAVRGRDLIDDIVLAIENTRADPTFRSLGKYIEVRQTAVQQEILEALEELMPTLTDSEYATAKDISEVIGTNREQVKRAVSRMMAATGKRTWKSYRITSKRGKKGGLRLEPT